MGVEIIAEIANSHQGIREKAIEIAQRAILNGADGVKFQMYTADDLMISSHERYKHFKDQSFSEKDWAYIFSKISPGDSKVYLDIFGPESFSISKNFKVDGYKIHFSDLTNQPLISLLAKTGKKILIGSGGATLAEIHAAINLVEDIGNNNITLLHGFQAYPTNISDTNLERFNDFIRYFGKRVNLGLSDHIDGDDILSKVVPMIALPYGIKVIEKHVTIDRDLRGVDYYSSLDMPEFKEFVELVREGEKALGSSGIFSNEELNYRNTVKKKWFTSRNLKKGHKISQADIIMKRDDSELNSLDFGQIIGKELTEDVQKDELIRNTFFNHYILGIVVARSSSSRLPEKATLPIVDDVSLTHLFKRLSISLKKGYIDEVAFCTTTKKEDDNLVDLVKGFPVSIHRGDVDNVLKRMSMAFYNTPKADIILRITGDDILIDPDYVQKSIDYHIRNNLDYTDAKGLPSGTEVEVINVAVLDTILKKAKDLQGTEYLTNYIVENKLMFKTGSLPIPSKHKKDYRLTLDTPDDYHLIAGLCKWLAGKGKKYDYNMDDIVSYFTENPRSIAQNQSVIQKKIPRKFSTELDLNVINDIGLEEIGEG